MDRYILNNTTSSAYEFSISLHCQHYQSYQDHYLVKAILSLLYSLIFVVAVSGNTLVIYVVATNRHMQSVTNIFITNLAVADLLVNFTSLWLTPCYIFLGRWVWGSVMCHAVPLFQGMSTFISALTLTAIAVDRYIVILHPFRPRMSFRCCTLVVIGIWITGSILVAPLVVHMNLHFYESCGEYVCREEWASYPNMQIAYGFVVMSLQFFVPFLVIAYCYVRIWIFLTHRKSLLSESSRSSVDEPRKKRLLKMMICMVVIFGVCWLPVNVLNVLRDMTDIDTEDYFVIVFLFAHLSSMSGTCWNPILYAWKNENFRREFQAVLPCFRNVTDRLRRTSSINRGVIAARRFTTRSGDQSVFDTMIRSPCHTPREQYSPFLHGQSFFAQERPRCHSSRSRDARNRLSAELIDDAIRYDAKHRLSDTTVRYSDIEDCARSLIVSDSENRLANFDQANRSRTKRYSKTTLAADQPNIVIDQHNQIVSRIEHINLEAAAGEKRLLISNQFPKFDYNSLDHIANQLSTSDQENNQISTSDQEINRPPTPYYPVTNLSRMSDGIMNRSPISESRIDRSAMCNSKNNRSPISTDPPRRTRWFKWLRNSRKYEKRKRDKSTGNEDPNAAVALLTVTDENSVTIKSDLQIKATPKNEKRVT